MSTFGDDIEPNLGEMAEKIIVGVTIIGIFGALILEKCTAEVAFLCALVIVMMTGVVDLPTALSGFSNQSLVSIGALFFVVAGVEKSYIVDYLARKAFGVSPVQAVGSARMYFSTFALSSVFNNTPLVAVMIPVVRDWGRVRGIALSQLLMPLSYASIAGGLLTMIGTSTSLTVQGLVSADKGYQFDFLAPAYVALPAGLLMGLYCVFAAPYLLPSKSGLIRELRDKASQLVMELEVTKDSEFKGCKMGSLCNAIGLAPTTVLKIRRLNRTANDRGNFQQHEGMVDSSLEHGISMQRRRSLESEKPDDHSPTPSHAGSSDDGPERRGNGISDSLYVLRTLSSWGMDGRAKSTPTSAAEADAADAAAVAALEQGGATSAWRDKKTDNRVSRVLADGDCVDILNPSHWEVIREGDILFVANGQELITKLMKTFGNEKKGLRILQSNVTDIPGFGTDLAEVVLSHQNPFLGRNLTECLSEFNEKYRVAVISTRATHHAGGRPTTAVVTATTAAMNRARARTQSKDDEEVLRKAMKPSFSPQLAGNEKCEDSNPELGVVETDGESTSIVDPMLPRVPDSRSMTLAIGDVLLCLSKDKDIKDLVTNKDFYVVSQVGSVPKPLTPYGVIPIFVFVIMIVSVAVGWIGMCPAALAVSAMFFVGGWIKSSEIPTLVDWRLLMLMGCALSFAKAMDTSGLASEIAGLMNSFQAGSLGSLFIVYLLTCIMTSLVSNNAAAALMYPFAVAVADELGVSFIPFVYVVMIAASAAFMSPIGYQTHLMVWGPGGYSFMDFAKFGLLPNIIFCVCTCLLTPLFFAF